MESKVLASLEIKRRANEPLPDVPKRSGALEGGDGKWKMGNGKMGRQKPSQLKAGRSYAAEGGGYWGGRVFHFVEVENIL